MPNPFAAPSRLTRLQVEITTGCNLHCAGCQRTIGMAAGTWHNGHMPEARFRAILANAPPTDALILQGIGEPTLHPDLPRLVALARASGKYPAISFNTNALLRGLPYYAALRGAGLNHVSVSVDSLDPLTAEAVRAGTDTARLETAIAGLLDLFGPGLTLSVVLSRRNAPQVEDLLARLHQLGGRVVELQPLIGYGTASAPLLLAPQELPALRRRIAAAAAQLPGLHLLLAPALTPNGTRCRRPLHAAYVTLDGFLTPCCTSNDTTLFGGANLAEVPFATLWQQDGVAGWMQRYVDAEPAICRGCAFNPNPPPATVADAEALLRAGRLDAAEAAFRALLGETVAAALHGIGLVHCQRGARQDAEPWLHLSHALAPEPRRSHNLAICLRDLGRIGAAVEIERAVVAADPGYVPAWFTLAGLLAQQGDAAGAAGTLLALGERAAAAERFDLAGQAVQQLIALHARGAAVLRLADLLRSAGRQDLAAQLAGAMLQDDPDDIAARLALAMSRLAVVHAGETEIGQCRAAYAADLDRLDAASAAAPPDRLAAAAAQVGNAKPFFLAYQGMDDRALQRSYGRIVSRIMHAAGLAVQAMPASRQPSASGPGLALPSISSPRLCGPDADAPDGPGEAAAQPARAANGRVSAQRGRLRVGFASAYFHLHSVSKLFGGWMRRLDPQRFSVFGYQFGTATDATSTALAAACTEYKLGDAAEAAWQQRIAADRLHVLIYPEIGMHPLPVRLGCRRLAPVQCAAWGHPVTTGLPEIDCFLSSELMEPPGADAHYTERLVRLPNLSICYDPLPDAGGVLPRGTLGLRDDAVVYVCCQSIFKYLPRFDAVFPRIAERVANAQFLFIAFRQAPTQQFRRRLEAAFAAAGLDAARHLCIVQPVPHTDFPALLRAGDVYLDSIGWSGGNTTLEALACDLPVVTWPTGLMRGRHSAAILRHIGLGAQVAGSVDQYVEQAAALADPVEREAWRAAMRSVRPRLYGDMAPIAALEAFLCDAAP